MLVLGIHGSFVREHEDPADTWLHDSAAAILADGEIIAAIEEERLSRVKHTSAFPSRAIAFCLDAVGARLSDCDLIAYNQSEVSVAIESRARIIKDPYLPRCFDRNLVASFLEEGLGSGDFASKLRFCSHHIAHAWSTFALSGFSSSLVACLDGGGENAPGPDLSGMIGRFDGEAFHVLREHPAESHSIGLWYRTAIALLGYRLFDEYKVMGLAPYGMAETYADLAASWYQLLPDGQFTLTSANSLEFFVGAHARGLLEQARRKGEPLTQAHKDLAFALQQSVEKVILHVLSHFQAETGERNLCLAGGVAHNCSANGRLLYSGMFDRIFVQPAAHDAGCAVGAALHAASMAGERIGPRRMRHVYLGTDATSDSAAVRDELESWGSFIRFGQVSDGLERRTAASLAAGRVVGWVQGRAEFGPRALGNRSILADPRPAENKDRINDMIKKREGYRPFAPSVIEESADSFFDLPNRETDLGFMTFVVKVKEEKRALLGAVTHVDGTARVQTIAADKNPRFHRLISEFGRLTDVPILLNTSFNNSHEPIVDSVRDAVACYLTTGLDLLVVGDYVVDEKENIEENPMSCLRLRISMRPSQRLTTTFGSDRRQPTHAIDTAAPIKGRPIVCSDAMFKVLTRLPSDRTLLALLDESNIPGSAHLGLAREAFELWQRRAIDLHP